MCQTHGSIWLYSFNHLWQFRSTVLQFLISEHDSNPWPSVLQQFLLPQSLFLARLWTFLKSLNYTEWRRSSRIHKFGTFSSILIRFTRMAGPHLANNRIFFGPLCSHWHCKHALGSGLLILDQHVWLLLTFCSKSETHRSILGWKTPICMFTVSVQLVLPQAAHSPHN